MDIKQTLWGEVLERLDAVAKIDPASNEDKVATDQIVKFADRVIELEKLDREYAEKEASRTAEYDFKNKQLEAELKLKERQLEAELKLKERQLAEEIEDRRAERKLKTRQEKNDRISRIIGHVLALTEIIAPLYVVREQSYINWHFETKGYLPSTNVGRVYTVQSIMKLLR